MTAPESTPSSPQSHTPPSAALQAVNQLNFSRFHRKKPELWLFFPCVLSSLKGLFLEEPGVSSFLHYASEEETKRALMESSPQWDCRRISRSRSRSAARFAFDELAAACKRLPFVIEIPPHLRDYWKTGMDFRIHRCVHFKERVISCRRHHPGALVDSR